MEYENMPEDQYMAELQGNTNHEGDEDIADQAAEQQDTAELEGDVEAAEHQGDEDQADEEAEADPIFQTPPNQRTKANMVDSNNQDKKVEKTIVMKKPSGLIKKKPSGLQLQKKKPSGLVKKKPSASKSEAFKKVTESEFRGRCHRLMWYTSGGFLAIRQTAPPKKQLVSCKCKRSQTEAFKIGMILIRQLEKR